MEINYQTIIKIEPWEVREIISKHLCNAGFECGPDDITYDIRNVLEGYGIGEHEVTKFYGCVAKCNNKK